MTNSAFNPAIIFFLILTFSSNILAYSVVSKSIITLWDAAPATISVDDIKADDIINTAEEGSISVPTGANPGDVITEDDGINPPFIIPLTPADLTNTSVNATVPLPPEGTNLTITATMTDAAGNVSAAGDDEVITNLNDPPVCNSDLAFTTENANVTVNVLSNDSDVDGDMISLVNVSVPIGDGSVSILLNEVVFNPGTDFDGLSSGDSRDVIVTYTISDGDVATSPCELSITVTGTNDAPVAVNEPPICLSEDAVDPVEGNVLDSDSDPDNPNNELEICEVNGTSVILGAVTIEAEFGLLTIEADGSYSYTPNGNLDYLEAGDSVSDVFTYVVCDADGDNSNKATITVKFEGVNDPPVAVNESPICLSEDAVDPVNGNVLDNDSDPDNTNDELEICAFAFGDLIAIENADGSFIIAGEYGALTIRADGSYSYTPNGNLDFLEAGDSVSDVFTYVVCDPDEVESNLGNITFEFKGVNDPPVANDDCVSLECNENTVFDILIMNDSDPDDDINELCISEITYDGNTFSFLGDRIRIQTEFGDLIIQKNGRSDFMTNDDAATIPQGGIVCLEFDYTIVDPSSAISEDATLKINITKGTPNISFTDPGDLCVDADAIALSGGSPAGGTYSGTGVVFDNMTMAYTFDPSQVVAGTYTITYTLNCVGMSSHEVEVFALPIVTIPDQTVCADAATGFDLTSIEPIGQTGGDWTDANDVAINTPSSVNISDGDSFTYSFTDPNTSCSSSDMVSFTVNDNPVVSISDQTICADAATGFDLTSLEPAGQSGGDWTDANDAAVNTPSSVTISDGDSFTYSFTDPNNSCAGSDMVSFTVNDHPVIAIPDQNICADDATEYDLTSLEPAAQSGGDWTDANDAAVSMPNSVTISDGDSFTYSFTNANTSCAGSDMVSFTVNDHPVIAILDQTICVDDGTEYDLTSLEPAALSGGDWTDANDAAVSTPSSVTILDGDSFTYSFTDPNTSCAGSDMVSFTVNDNPVITIPDQTICADEATEYDLTSLEPAALSGGDWTDANDAALSTPSSVTILDGDSFTYSFTDPNTGCSGSDVVSFTVNDNPVVSISNQTLCADAATGFDLTSLEPTGQTEGDWTDTNDEAISTPSSVNISDDDNFTYSYTDTNTDCVGSITVSFTVNSNPVISILDQTLCVGAMVTLEGSGTPATISPWISASTNVATINTTGDIKGISVGTSLITYTNSDGCTNNMTVKVFACLDDMDVLSITDPCSCSNINNIRLIDGRFLFNDTLRVMSGTAPVKLATSDDLLLDEAGNPIQENTSFTFNASTNMYELVVYTEEEQASSITISNGVSIVPFIVGPCTPCPTIPTLGQWGLICLSLLLLIISVIGQSQKDKSRHFAKDFSN